MIGGAPRHGGTKPGGKPGPSRPVARSPRGNGRRAPRVPFALLVTGLVIGAMALLLALNTFSAANELRRHDLALRDEMVAAQVEQLRNEVAASAAPGNLASAAAAMGMVPAGNPAFIVDVAGRLLVRGHAAPVPYPVVPLPTSSAATPTQPATTPATSPAKTPAAKSTTAGAAQQPVAGHPAATTAAAATSAATSAAESSTAGPAHHRAARRHGVAHSQAASPTPAPTPTPTDTVTMPGGPR